MLWRLYISTNTGIKLGLRGRRNMVINPSLQGVKILFLVVLTMSALAPVPIWTSYAEETGIVYEIVGSSIYGSETLEYAVGSLDNVLVAGPVPAIIDINDLKATVFDDMNLISAPVVVGKGYIIFNDTGGKIYISTVKRPGDARLITGYKVTAATGAPTGIIISGKTVENGKPFIGIIDSDLQGALLYNYDLGKAIFVEAAYLKGASKIIAVTYTQTGELYIISTDGSGVMVNAGSILSRPRCLETDASKDTVYVALADTSRILIIMFDSAKEKVDALELVIPNGKIIDIKSVQAGEYGILILGKSISGGFIINIDKTSSEASIYKTDNFIPYGLKSYKDETILYGSASSYDINISLPVKASLDHREVTTAKIKASVSRTTVKLAGERLVGRQESISKDKIIDYAEPAVVKLRPSHRTIVSITIREAGLQPLSKFTDDAWVLIDNSSKYNLSVHDNHALIRGLSTGKHLIEVFYRDRETGYTIMIYHGFHYFKEGYNDLHLYRNTPYIDGHLINNSVIILTLVNPSNMTWRGHLSIILSNGSSAGNITFQTPGYPSRIQIHLRPPGGSGWLTIVTHVAIGNSDRLTHVYRINYGAPGTTSSSPNKGYQSTTNSPATPPTSATSSEPSSSNTSLPPKPGNTWIIAAIIITVIGVAAAFFMITRHR